MMTEAQPTAIRGMRVEPDALFFIWFCWQIAPQATLPITGPLYGRLINEKRMSKGRFYWHVSFFHQSFFTPPADIAVSSYVL
jgi:hypothetical protein